jgi:uncharacterized membrane protein YgdD (TMEM256/DUF423 family)
MPQNQEGVREAAGETTVPNMERMFLAASGISGFLAVLLGAFGAHGLKRFLETIPDGAKRHEWWQTAAHYHLVHAVAIGFVAYLAGRTRGSSAMVAGIAFVIGTVLFSGSLYAMTLTGLRGLGAITPIGGLAFLVGWAAVVVAALNL